MIQLGDKNAVEKAPHLLQGNVSADDILKNTQWNKNFTMLNEEIKKQLDSPSDEINGIIMKKINTSYNIISTITRKVAWESGKNTLVLNTGFFDIEIFKNKRTLASFISTLKKQGYKQQ